MEQRTIDMVAAHGWQIMAVSTSGHCCHPDHGPDDPHGPPSDEPDFAYTIGLGHRFGHPELLMSGLERPDALVMVWPTTTGHFPGHPGAPDVLEQLQPRSWRHPLTHRAA